MYPMESLKVKIRNSLGTFVWFADYGFYKITKLFTKTPELNNPKNILVVEIAGIGDTIGATPVIRTLKEYYPDANIDALVSEQASPLLQCNPHLRNILVYSNLTLKRIKNKYNLAVLLAPGSGKISRLLKEAKIPFRIGCTRRGITQGKGFYLTLKAKPLMGITHTIDNNLNVLKTLDMVTSNRAPELFTSKSEDNAVLSLLKKYKIKSKDSIIILSPGSRNIESSKYPSHLWPSENFAKMGDYFADNARIIILGNEKEFELAGRIKSIMHGRSINLAGELNLRQIMALLKRASWVIAVDSGIMHIAEALNVPLVSIFGPQNPKRWQPLSENSITMYNDKVCTGCQRYSCSRRDNICMKSITPEMVINAIKEFER